ncbi:DUF4132 domain-containing protein [Dactylosporangium siamense]|uniref:DUF4132 domain-containing protein n=1 Tax=Dactylosporangium siamense TaxID=685454 RepID=A0A919Q0R8_9ACTN|nr:DUF4132 domain-containing protein [Dactylosporangium siamense]GIG51800.1 hypothetical protein Dsi01nite_098410 [Dactylosporangium siamense]
MTVETLDTHRARAAVVLPAAIGFNEHAVERFLRRDLPDLDDAQIRSVTVALAERAAAYVGWGWHAARLFPALANRRPAWTATDAELLFDLAHRAPEGTLVTVLRIATGAAETLDLAGRTGLVERFRDAQKLVEAPSWHEAGERANLLRRLARLADNAADGAAAWAGRIRIGDGWSRAVVEHLRTAPAGVDALGPLLDHALTLTSGPRPTKVWLRRTGELLDGRPELVGLVRDLLDLAHAAPPAVVAFWHGDFRLRVGPDNGDVLRGLLWTAQVSGEPWLVPLALALEPTLHEPKPLNACYAVLGRRADDAAIAALVRMQRRTRHRGKLKQIAAALDEAAAGAGVSRSELTELTVPDCGLDEHRQRRIGTAVVSVDAGNGPARVRVAWEHGGTTTTKPPADVDAELAAEVRRATTDLKKTLADERQRLEDLLVEDRDWPLETWRERYLEHPVTGALADRLLWTVDENGRRFAGLPTVDGRFILADGGTVEPGPGARIRLWHPVDADPEEVRAWRAHILDNELTQPFKQAFREVYLLTPAEEETRVYSNRFAAHILRYQQAYALMKERRWGSNYLGDWNDGWSGEAKREFPAAGLTAVFHHDQATDDGRGPVQFCATDRVRFELGRGRARQDVPLAEVPARVFAEAMRDVDLFVGVTSIATDPTWADRGDEPRFDYWRSFAFGDLTANGQVRRQVLEHLLPKLKIRDRARLDGHYLVVEGRLHTYRIHIGSGNILMSPNDRYLCIVPTGAGKPTGVRFLPFEGDAMLSIVLSKALLLADDHKIKDPSILRQLGQPGRG